MNHKSALTNYQTLQNNSPTNQVIPRPSTRLTKGYSKKNQREGPFRMRSRTPNENMSRTIQATSNVD